jgi:imidazolonepropionase-like amidohydrolase
MRLRFLALSCLSTLLWAQPKPDLAAQELVLTGVHIVGTRDGSIQRNMTVVVKDGRIEAIARVGLIGKGRGLRVINASGKYVIPGLWDMHVHSAFADAAWDENVIYPLYIANGVTGIRDMGGDADLLERRRQRINRGDLLGPHMVMGGPFLDGGKNDAQTLAVDTPAKARDAVDGVKKRGFDFVKILSRIPRDSYFAIADEAKKDKIQFVGHVPDTVSVAEASTAGQRSIEHLTGISLACSSKETELRQLKLDSRAKRDFVAYEAAGMQALASYDPGKARALFIQFANNNTWQVPTLVWTHANATLDDPDGTSDPRLKYVPATVRAQWDPKKLQQQTSPEQFADLKEEFARDLELVNAMQRSGVPLLAGSDGPDPYVFPGFSLHDELEWLVKSGLTPLQALQAATSGPAHFLDDSDKYGTVEKGKVAGLVLLDANPIEDIRNTRKIAAVVVGGKYYPREELDKILAQVEAAAAKE